MSGKSQFTFPLHTKVGSSDASYAELQKQLGSEAEAHAGKIYRLVQAATADALTGRSKVYAWAAFGSYTVDLAGSGDPPCGVQTATQATLAAGDLFWLQIAGRATVTDDSNTIAANDVVVAAATGDVVTVADMSLVAEDVVGVALEAFAANATGTVQLRGGL